MDFDKTKNIVMLSQLLVEKTRLLTTSLYTGVSYPEREILRAEIKFISEGLISQRNGEYFI